MCDLILSEFVVSNNSKHSTQDIASRYGKKPQVLPCRSEQSSWAELPDWYLSYAWGDSPSNCPGEHTPWSAYTFDRLQTDLDTIRTTNSATNGARKKLTFFLADALVSDDVFVEERLQDVYLTWEVGALLLLFLRLQWLHCHQLACFISSRVVTAQFHLPKVALCRNSIV